MRIVMTGATAGIGLEAAKQLVAMPGTELIVGARTPERVPAALGRKTVVLPLDLASLASVRGFAAAAGAAGPIDVLLFNAGMQTVRSRTSAEGYELTVAVNHFAHYLLLRLLAAELAANARVVLTASGTHDPDEKTGMPNPHHADAQRLAFPETDPQRDASAGTAGRRAYTQSKLCNVMTVRELAVRLAATRPDIAVASFDPGFTPGTGLARDYPGPAGAIFRYVLPMVAPKKPGTSTPAVSGRLLADMVTAPAYASARGDYFAVRSSALVAKSPSALAQDAAACARLWDDSARLVGL
jgi:protochlorophyllide reductase